MVLNPRKGVKKRPISSVLTKEPGNSHSWISHCREDVNANHSFFCCLPGTAVPGAAGGREHNTSHLAAWDKPPRTIPNKYSASALVHTQNEAR